MINKILTWIMIFNRFVHSRMVIDVLTDVWVEEIREMLVGGFVINVWADMVIGTLSTVYVDVTFDVVSDIGIEVLTDVNNVLIVAAITDLSFAMSEP